MEYTETKICFVAYLKFSFNWVSRVFYLATRSANLSLTALSETATPISAPSAFLFLHSTTYPQSILLFCLVSVFYTTGLWTPWNQASFPIFKSRFTFHIAECIYHKYTAQWIISKWRYPHNHNPEGQRFLFWMYVQHLK